jgi:Big-like domain-containing protein/putative Ig domain-containing protein
MIGDLVRRISALLFTLVALIGTCATVLGLSAAASASESGTAYTAETAVVDTVSEGPWNTSQGDPSAGGTYASADLLPTFAFGGAETTIGGVNEPNVAVYPGTGTVPYPSGVAGTPGPLDGYCSSLGANPETGSPVSQPAGSSLPFSPYYFPDVVRNADGSLTGYFDYRPKDADEAITVARSSDGGKSWTSEGKALEQNPGYCPTADTNDDGQGHPYVAPIGASTKLYTLNRPAGDYEGVGLLVHDVEPSAADPLAALPAAESVGIDPNTYAESEVEVATSGGVSIPVSTLGSEGSPEHIVAGPYEDYNASSPSNAIVTCTGTSSEPLALTGCTVAGTSPLLVKPKDDLVQVIATANPEEVTSKEPKKGATYTIPAGPNKPTGEGGLEKLSFLNGNSVVAPFTTFILNENAPNRVYIDGATVYCTQSNANPTTKIEDCTTADGSPLVVHQGDAITADPIVPPNATMTTGLRAPDGIVGTLPSYPGAPAKATVVLYTEKLLAYFIVGTTNGSVSGSTFKAGSVTLPGSGSVTINYTPSVHPSEPLPSTGSFKIYLGTTVTSPIQEVTCTAVTPATQTGVPAGSENLTGCTGGTGTVKEGNWVGGPNAAVAPLATLEKIGEGKNSSSKGPEKLFANNEDYTVLRAAYTENGINFTDLGPISGTASATGNDTGSYDDISNPNQQTSPSSSTPTDLAAGESDTTELRYVGSRGTIVTNPDGSYGMFLSGAWATDGDSDAFNQIFYTSSTNGKEWSVPKVVLSTDYTFSASAKQNEDLAKGEDTPLGVSAYYSGRAYGPAVVQNPGGSLTMIFSGYRLPKPITAAGTVLGTNPASRYTIGAKDLALYRNILTVNLKASTSPGVPTTTTLISSGEGKGVVGKEVTYTATVAPVAPGAGTPTGPVAFVDSQGPIAECEAVQLSLGSPDTATCTTELTHTGANEVTASYSGDANYAASSGTASESVEELPAITSGDSATFTLNQGDSFTVTASGVPTPAISESGPLPTGVEFKDGVLSGTPTQEGVYPITLTATNEAGFSSQSFTLTVDAPAKITSADSTTFSYGSPGTFTVSASGTPAPVIEAWGTLPAGVSFTDGVLSGTPEQTGTFQITLTASNGIGGDSVQRFNLTVLGLHVTTRQLPEATLASPYSQQLQATGGIAPYKWRVSAGKLPKGLKLTSSGLLTGTVSAKKYPSGGSFPITVTVTDHSRHVHQLATATFTLVVSR